MSTGLKPVWSIAPTKCPHCDGIRDCYPEADLQKMRGPRLGQDMPAEKPVKTELHFDADTARRMLEALR